MDEFRVIILMVALLPWRSNSCFVSFESEFGTSTGTSKYRDNASNGITVSLLQGQYVENTFITTQNCILMIANVAYSNDGIGDYITASVDGNVIGNFHTRALTGDGDLWNVIRHTGPIGNETQIAAGEHAIRLLAASADNHGVELDKITVTLLCGTDTNSDTECPTTEVEVTDTGQGAPDDGSDDSGGGLSTGAIIGIIFGTIGVVIAVPGCIVATWTICKYID